MSRSYTPTEVKQYMDIAYNLNQALQDAQAGNFACITPELRRAVEIHQRATLVPKCLRSKQFSESLSELEKLVEALNRLHDPPGN